MGDGGLCVGAAALCYSLYKKNKQYKIKKLLSYAALIQIKRLKKF